MITDGKNVSDDPKPEMAQGLQQLQNHKNLIITNFWTLSDLFKIKIEFKMKFIIRLQQDDEFHFKLFA